ncbi:hypothetical protein FQN50_005060 [Emmonsiellopsis sp. PD_5]|nr:hypothetical protein FQN50_005060 [Emmonsiellopsis sp. PD_5]
MDAPHTAAVATISHTIRNFHRTKTPFRIYHGSTNSTRPTTTAFHPTRLVDTSSLNRILHIDKHAATALVEPKVSMDQLVAATLPHGLIPPVVMEFPGITVGGAFAGLAGESSSFRWGLFDKTVRWVEVVLGDGEVVGASAEENADLFYGMIGAMGTVGVVTALEVRLVTARRFVEVTYWPVEGAGEAGRVVRREMGRGPGVVDYVDGILFGGGRGLVMAGRLTDEITADGGGVKRFTRAWDDWFYTHAEAVCERAFAKQKQVRGPIVETVPLVDYLFRYDRGAFWAGARGFNYFHIPFNRFTRWLFNGLMHTRTLYHALHRSGFSHRSIVQDLAIPHSKAEEFIQFIDETLHCYPLWLCPIRLGCNKEGHQSFVPRWITPSPALPQTPNADAEGMYLNVGVWCIGPASHSACHTLNRTIEAKVQSLQGAKCLYAHAHYTEDEFWTIYDHAWYTALRERYAATYLPDVYEKVKTDHEAARRAVRGVWRVGLVAGVYGVLSALVGGEYLVGEGRGRRRVGAGVVLALVVAVVVGVVGV